MSSQLSPDTCHEVSLNGLWDFTFLGEGPIPEHPGLDGTDWEKIWVPSAFDATQKYAGQRGRALYRRKLIIPSGQEAELTFGALSMWSRVRVDNEVLSENACGYAPQRIRVPAVSHPERLLVVEVDNRFDFEHMPMHEEYFDFYQYGGIIRDVCLRVLPAHCNWIEAVRVCPTQQYRDGEILLEVDCHDSGAVDGVSLALDSADAFKTQSPERTEHGFRMTLAVPAPRLWSPDDPQLHTMQVRLLDSDGTTLDQQSARFGLRRIEAKASKLWLNGDPLILKGYNRHEWHPNFGPSTPTAQLVNDIQLLKGMGCNFVRGSHYPQDQRFLDLCDELGVLVWEENLGWGQRRREVYEHPKFMEDHAKALNAMIRESFNHPSIIIWGFLNECDTEHDYIRPYLEQILAEIRSIDTSRLTSYGSIFGLKDKHYDLIDLISINCYPGWYGCEYVRDPITLIRPHFDKLFAYIDSVGCADKPVIISEIGAEALYGWREPHHDFFTEAYQARYLGEAIEAALGNPRCSGIALWHFSDVRTYSGGLALQRPRTFNNKGTFDEYRRPKAAYTVVKELFEDI